MKRFFGKRRATRKDLGELSTPPFGRLGALVFQLNNSDTLYWANPWVPTRIAGCALSPRGWASPAGKTFPPKDALPTAGTAQPGQWRLRRNIYDQFFALSR